MLNIIKILILLILMTSLSEYKCFGDDLNMNKTILVGASIGEGWKFDELPVRLGLENQTFMYISFFEKDTIKKVQSIASAGDRVILKLCAANFRVYDSDDSDDILSEQYKTAFVRWVDLFKDMSVEPVLATVIPLTESLPMYYTLRKLIKKHILLRHSKKINRVKSVQIIGEFNIWARDFAIKNELKVLDLEKATVDKNTGYLNADFSTDGLHLNKNGYMVLDKLAFTFFKDN